jgi:hypothetical protein
MTNLTLRSGACNPRNGACSPRVAFGATLFSG